MENWESVLLIAIVFGAIAIYAVLMKFMPKDKHRISLLCSALAVGVSIYTMLTKPPDSFLSRPVLVALVAGALVIYNSARLLRRA